MNKEQREEAQAVRRKRRVFKRLAIWLVVFAGLGGIIFFLVSSGGNGGGPVATGGSIPPVTESDWVKWNPDSPVKLIEYSDFQCPACGAYYPILNAVEQKYGDKVAFIYRNYPIYQIHPNANAAARAAEAAGIQGKFWEMYDLLFKSQSSWSPMTASDAANVFAGFAGDLGINVDQFLSDFNSSEVQDRVTEDYQAALSAGVNSTPTFYLNGEKILRNPSDVEGFGTLLDAALANAENSTQ